MKHRIAALFTVVGLICVGAAVALGGTAGDPLIAKSYLEGTYAAELTAALEQKASDSTKTRYDETTKKLETTAKTQMTAAEAASGNGSGSYGAVKVARGDRLSLAAGDSVMFYAGSAKVESGALADVTDGKNVNSGGTLAANHRYIATSATVIQQTKDGSLGFEGAAKVVKGNGTVTEALPFTDVKAGDWYYSAVSFAYEKGYFSGVGEGLFAPNTAMSRGMLATVLYRLSGETYSGKTDFSDVVEGAWYTTAIGWANEKGIVKGMGGNMFMPDEFVTREQMVTMLYRYQEYKKGDVTGRGSLSGFPDSGQVSAWAKDGIEWAVGKGLLTGRNTGELDPAGTATRAEVATILQRFDSLS